VGILKRNASSFLADIPTPAIKGAKLGKKVINESSDSKDGEPLSSRQKSEFLKRSFTKLYNSASKISPVHPSSSRIPLLSEKAKDKKAAFQLKDKPASSSLKTLLLWNATPELSKRA